MDEAEVVEANDCESFVSGFESHLSPQESKQKWTMHSAVAREKTGSSPVLPARFRSSICQSNRLLSERLWVAFPPGSPGLEAEDLDAVAF